MPTFLVELYLPQRFSVEEVAERALRAANGPECRESGVSYVRSTHVAEEETCFVVFEAPSRESVEVVARVAGWEPAQVIEAVEAEGSTQGRQQEGC